MKRRRGSAVAEVAALPVAEAFGEADLPGADSEVEWSGAETSGVQDLQAEDTVADLPAEDTVVALRVAGLGTSAL